MCLLDVYLFNFLVYAFFVGELHIFQCVSHDAVNVVDDIYQWMRHYGITPSSPSTVGEKAPASNVNVKEAVTVFNQIAAQREK